jgi:magnesium transporter
MSTQRSSPHGLRSVEHGKVTWIDLDSPNVTSLARLKERFPHFLDMDLRNCLPPYQRPKLLVRDEYLFMVLLFPVYDTTDRSVRPVEVDFFIGKDYIVSVHGSELTDLVDLSKTCATDATACGDTLGEGTGKTLHSMLHRLLTPVFQLVTRVSNDIMHVERKVFEEDGADVVREILRIRGNIVQCRQAMQGHAVVIDKLITRASMLFDTTHLRTYYSDLHEHAQEIDDYLENDKETIDAIYDSHISLVTYATNDAMRKLTALTLVLLPTTLVATIFSMNSDHTPVQGHPSDFWIMLGLVFATMVGTVLFLHRKRWL